MKSCLLMLAIIFFGVSASAQDAEQKSQPASSKTRAGQPHYR
jgi:hypothetical protein